MSAGASRRIWSPEEATVAGSAAPSVSSSPGGSSSGTRDWANLTTELTADIADRLLAVHAAEYIRFRAVCSPWRVSTDDPRAGGALDLRFRPRGWSLLFTREPTLPTSIYQYSTNLKAAIDQQEFSSHHFLGSASGLIVLCDKATSVVRLFNPLTGHRVDFPAIINVRAHDAVEESYPHFLDMDALKGSLFNPGIISRFAGIDDSTSPPTLLLNLRNESWHIVGQVGAKPGDEHWLCLTLHLRGLSVTERNMVNCFNIGRAPNHDY
jgi:hypothetical protein